MSYKDLMAYVRQTEAIAAVAGRTEWDQETMMPAGAAEQRAEELAAMEAVLHARRTDPRIGDWLAAAEGSDEIAKANLWHIRRSFEREQKIPAELAQELARVTSLGQGVWAKARAADDVAAFLPTLEHIVKLKREEAAAVGGDPYDALLDTYEPEGTGAELQAMFDALRPRLVALRDKVLGQPAPPPLAGKFDEDKQVALATEMAVGFGYDLNHGRVDKVVHPFCSGGGQDVRITTRTDPNDPFNCIYSTVHETGHAAYEQNIDDAYLFTPLGSGVSMGVHESQSRIYENQLARSGPYCHWLHGRMTEHFGDLGLTPQGFFKAANRVENGFIRTEADELSYNLHVMLRFDLERNLITGALDVADLEEAWNSRFKADFGVDVPKPSLGVLQDVHWSCGLFGYFPTYSLGNVYAGCLMKAIRRDVEGLDEGLANGDPSLATHWLNENVQRSGSLYRPAETIERACGFAPSEEPLLDYLEDKFTGLYAL